MKKVNIGCGEDFSEDLIGIDMYDYGQQHILDVEKDPLPFDDDSIDKILANHSVEHFRDCQFIFNEAWRVLRKGGEFEIKVPNFMWQGAHKPVHFQHCTLSWFDWFRRPKTKVYGYQPWEIRVLEMRNFTSDVPEGKEIYCVLSPKK